MVETWQTGLTPASADNGSQEMGLHSREKIRKCVYVWRKPGHPPGLLLATT